MDRDNFNAIINRFLEKFDYTNGAGTEEWFKWDAIVCFQNNWNIDAPNFSQMFSKAVKQFSVLIDNGHASPVSGLKTLLNQEGEAELVRGAFRELYADDGGDLDLRQRKAEKFVEVINERIEAHWPGSHKYPQSMRSAILFLTMRYPADNYILFWSRADNWATYTEFADDFGAGSSFSLKKYYRMCDELRAEIANSQELQKCNEKRMEAARVKLDDDYHTLVYDIIYCATCYDLYIDIPIFGKSVSKRLERAKDRAELEQLRMAAVNAEQEVSKHESLGCLPPDLVGHAVANKYFGNGVVTFQSKDRIKAQFGDQEKTFIYPTAFSLKQLMPLNDTDSQEIIESVAFQETLAQLKKEKDSKASDYEKRKATFQKKWAKAIHNDVINTDDA